MIGIISDIHANYPALCKVLYKFDALSVTEIICLGDIAGYYSQINECCTILRKRNIVCLLGNHDFYLTTDTKCPRSRTANLCLDFQKKIISDDNLGWLKQNKPTLFKDGILYMHGGLKDVLDEYVVPSDEYFRYCSASICVAGHTHIPQIWYGKTVLFCNPGSVGQPRDGDARASFATLENTKFTIYKEKYDFTLTQERMLNAGFSPYISKNLQYGLKIGQKI